MPKECKHHWAVLNSDWDYCTKCGEQRPGQNLDNLNGEKDGLVPCQTCGTMVKPERAGLTPDQPAAPVVSTESCSCKQDGALIARDETAAPDEDAAVRELAEVIAGYGNDYPASWCMGEAKHIHKAGYRRPVDTRPTMTVSEYKWAHAKRWGTGNPVYADWLVEIGVLAPDPAPAAEVPVVEVTLPEDARERIAKWLSADVWGSWENCAVQESYLIQADNLLAALTKATDR